MRWKDIPSWLKFLSFVSLLIMLLLLGLSLWILRTTSNLSMLAGIMFLVYIGVIIGMWLLGLLNFKLVKIHKRKLANVISIIILVLLIGYFIYGFVLQIIKNPELLGKFTDQDFFLLPLMFLILYLTVSLKLINEAPA